MRWARRPRRRRSWRSCSRRAMSCWSRGRAASGSRSSRRRCQRPRGASAPPRESLMGEVLIAGTASLLICIFLSHKFISFLRRREFGQQIREEGPQEHHAKAGTPTTGRNIIFTAIAVPVLLLTDFEASAAGVIGVATACALLGFADDYVKVARRRSLGLRGRTKLIVTVLIAIGLWLVATQWADMPDTIVVRLGDYTVDVGILYPVFIYLVLAGTT